MRDLTYLFLGAFGATLGWWLAATMDEPSAKEVARNYHAYRACIQRSNCRMTAKDWIDYYDLKYEIEEKEVD